MSSQVLDAAKKVDDLENQLVVARGELLALAGASNGNVVPTMVQVPVPGKKRGPKPGSKRGPKPVAGTRTGPSAHVAVKSILKRHKNGLVLADITKELEDMRKKGEFQSNAKSLTNIASVALQKLKGEEPPQARRDNDTQHWLAVG